MTGFAGDLGCCCVWPALGVALPDLGYSGAPAFEGFYCYTGAPFALPAALVLETLLVYCFYRVILPYLSADAEGLSPVAPFTGDWDGLAGVAPPF
jgi:hypothetical protein